MRGIFAGEIDCESLRSEDGVTVPELHLIRAGRRVHLQPHAVNLVQVLERRPVVAVDVGVVDENAAGQRCIRTRRQDLAVERLRPGDRGSDGGRAEGSEHLVPGEGRDPCPLGAWRAVAHQVVRVGGVVDLARVGVIAELLDAGRVVREVGVAVVRAAVIAAGIRVVHVVVVRQFVAEDGGAAARGIDARATREVICTDANDAEAAGVRIYGHVGVATAIALRIDPTVDVLGAGQRVGAEDGRQDAVHHPF